MSDSIPSVLGSSDRLAVSAESTPPAETSLIGERYRLELSIGAGGMGCVHLATDTFTGGTVAIKMLRPDLANDMLVRSRLQREASIGARVKSRNVVRLLDHGDDDKAGPYIVFEYLRGESLADVLDRRRALGALDAVRVAIDVLEGLSAFHGSGLVHRDVKPENVFLVRERSADGTVRHTARLIDFGLSRAIASTQDGTERVTLEGIVAGTPEYMAPEQISDSPAQDQHVDLYATGVMLYQMLSGKVPFVGDKTDAIFDRVLAGTARPLAEVAPSVDTAVARIVHRAMMKDPSKRYHSAVEMIAALRTWESRHAATAVARENEPTEKLASIAATPRQSAAPKVRRTRKRPLRALITAAGGGAVALVLAVLAVARHGEPPAISHPAPRPVLDARVTPAPSIAATAAQSAPHAITAAPVSHATARVEPRPPVARVAPSPATPASPSAPPSVRAAVIVRRPVRPMPMRRPPLPAVHAARPGGVANAEAFTRPAPPSTSAAVPENPY